MTQSHTHTDNSLLHFDSASMPCRSSNFSYFALTDALIQHAGDEQKPLIHFWSTNPLVILGMMDTKLPYLNGAVDFLKESHEVVVRNSGGLAVVSDPGVLNLSLIFPETEERLPIMEGYKKMHQLISSAFSTYEKTIDAEEIPDSYCPGDYDLSIDGKKIAGISQRRIKGGVAIMIYLTVNGNQKERANLIREFYTKGLNGEKVKWHFPKVNPEVMTTLEDAFEEKISVREVKERILNTLQEQFHVEKGRYTDLIHHHYMHGLEKMEKRNKPFL